MNMSHKMYMKLAGGWRPSSNKNNYATLLFESTLILITDHIKEGVAPQVI